jgi:hypothetical protein
MVSIETHTHTQVCVCVCVYLFIYLYFINNQENSIKTHLENIEEYSYIKMDVKVICV